jgi:hypothetical protein
MLRSRLWRDGRRRRERDPGDERRAEQDQADGHHPELLVRLSLRSPISDEEFDCMQDEDRRRAAQLGRGYLLMAVIGSVSTSGAALPLHLFGPYFNYSPLIFRDDYLSYYFYNNYIFYNDLFYY